jgi:hypothetical protein
VCASDSLAVGLTDLLREERCHLISTRAVMVGGFLVDNDGSDRIPHDKTLPAGGALAGVAGCNGRLFTAGSEVIVTATCLAQFILAITSVSRRAGADVFARA